MPAAEYRKLTFIAWLLAAVVMIVTCGSAAWQATNWYTDDFMRLVQVKDLLAGQAWNDLTQYRLGSPGGTAMHWSRLPDVPIALVALALSPLLGLDDALAAAAVVLPPVYMLIFLLPFASASRLLLGAAWSPVALLVAFTGWLAIGQLLPGRTDHHGLQLGLTMVAVALLLLGLASRRWRRGIAFAGLPIGLSIWIGLETAPVIATWFAALGLVWCRRGGDLARHAAAAAAVAWLVCLAALVGATPPAHWLVPACDALSIVPMTGLALIAAGFGVLHVLQRWTSTPALRVGCAGLCGAVVALAFLLAYPGCIRGYGLSLEPLVEEHWLAHVEEAQPLGRLLLTAPLKALAILWTPLLGLVWCLYRVARARGRARDLWLTIAILLVCPTLLMLGQVRASMFAQLIALFPLASLIAALWRRLRFWPRVWRYAVRAAALLLCSALFWPVVEALAERRPEPRAEPVTTSEPRSHACRNRHEIAPLAKASPGLILSYIDLGPKLLLSTPHAVLAAPYHRDNAGLAMTIELFRANDDAMVRQTLRALGIGWIVTCPGAEERTSYRTADGNGLAERLATGRVPEYLEPVSNSAQPGVRLYRVMP